jgi:hypothetical protein
MFNPFHKLLRFLGAADASVTEDSKTTTSKDEPSESPHRTTLEQRHDSKSDPAYRAAFNHAAPPIRYASGVFNTSPAPIPKAALSGYSFARSKVQDATAPRISNIPPPLYSMFGAPVCNDTNRGAGDSPPTSDDIDMPDANPLPPPTPPTSPPRDNDTQRFSEEPSREDNQNTKVRDDSTSGSHNNTTPTPTECDDCPHSKPQGEQEQQHTTTSHSTVNWTDEIEIEEDLPENNLPVGYMGMFRGTRHFIPEYPGMKLCSNNVKHLLLCGHWIDSTEPCGSNCKKQDHSQKQFNCPTCQDIVREILTGSFSISESTRLRNMRKKKDLAFLACCVEQVTRAAPHIKTGVTEAVAGFSYTDYGRKCERAENPDPAGHDTIEWLVRDMQKCYERKQREKLAQKSPFNTSKKRKRDEGVMDSTTDANTSAHEDFAADHEQPAGQSSTSDRETQNTSSRTDKKQKTTLESPCEPITPSTRGQKRRFSFSSSTSSLDNPNASPFAHLPNSKTSSSPPHKKVFVKPDPEFGRASFVIAPAEVVGALRRKRHREVYVEGAIERENKKRRVGSLEKESEKEGDSWRVRGKVFGAFRTAWDGRKEEED